ncbi:MAG: InlB B-repeat-containing protein [Firmicutes bacterium]|nr:InlB B-repeat-containing protein [Bacillota bacterium]
MKLKNILNRGMGFSGQLGKLGTVILELVQHAEDTKDVMQDISGLQGDVADLEALLLKIKAVTNITVAFDSDGGSSVDSQTIPFGTTAEEPKDPTKEDYLFDGWHLGDVLFDFETEIENNIELKAVWSEEAGGGE